VEASNTTVFFATVIDNTLFPYPNGAYSYSGINIDIITTLSVTVSTSYEELGKRLVFINTTVFLIFIVIIAVIIFKANKIAKRMKSFKGGLLAN
jgi:hypothetical protein